jgi:hypothetical protein
VLGDHLAHVSALVVPMFFSSSVGTFIGGLAGGTP